MQPRTGLVYDERYLKHQAGPWHPERPERLEAIYKRFKESGLLEQVKLISPHEAPLTWVEKLHDPGYIRRFKQACERGDDIFQTPDCGICPESYEIALLAVGGVMAAVDEIMAGTLANALAPVRPPGHHAEKAQALGFCFFNNVALGALYLLENFGLERVAVVDWDLHHGNGTQHLFEADPRVFYLSLHEDPMYCYPGTGYRREQGKGPGQGFTQNLPLPPGSGDAEYLKALKEEGLPRLRQFAPQFLLISAGFDAHQDDPLGHQKMTREGYLAMGRLLLALAQETAEGRVITVLEGGYSVTVLADCLEDHLRLLMGQEV
jgi:acetoin utilization deacetylase AcuC-like enzyme